MNMRFVWVALVILLLCAIDRAYLDGQNTALLVSFARSAGMSINQQVDDLLRPLRR
jgi:hypothetical protein